jgi:hypothetical protein
MISAVAFASALYSDSVLERETVACFLALQEMRLPPKNIAYPPVDQWSSTLPAQSASEKADRSGAGVGEDLNSRPCERVAFT